MSFLSDPSNIGNILRLKALSPMGTRKRVRPAGDMMDMASPDVEGTGNEPIPDLAQGGLAPESYDVRANQVIIPEQPEPLPPEPVAQETSMEEPPASEEQKSLWSRIGQGLANYARNQFTPSINTPAPQQPEVPQEETPGIFSRVGQAINEYRDPEKAQELRQERENILESARARQAGLPPPVPVDNRGAINAQIETAMQNPWETAVYGAADEVANRPELQAQFKEITGIDWNPQVDELVSKYEEVISGLDENYEGLNTQLDTQAQSIRDRINNNQASDADKYYIGLALLMPLIVGGFFGAEAGLGTLAGAAGGMADIYNQRAQDIRTDEETLRDIVSQQGDLATKRAELQASNVKIRPEIVKNLPKDEREFLKGKKQATWTNPVTGEQETGVEIKPGIIARPEFLTSQEDYKELIKEASDINQARTATKEINDLTQDVIEITSQLKNKGIVGQAISDYIGNKKPAFLSKITQDVNLGGRKVNAGIALESKLKLLTDAYRQAKGMRALTQSVQDHIDNLFRNPVASFQSPEDTINQMLYLRDLTQKRLVEHANNAGFAGDFLGENFGKANKGLYSKLNRKEGEKEASALLRE